MPDKNRGRECAQRGALSVPSRLLSLKLPTFHRSQNVASNASLEMSVAYYSKFSPGCGRDLQEHARKPIQDPLPFRGKGMPKPLYNTAARRRNVTRGDYS